MLKSRLLAQYQEFYTEIQECRRIGLRYVATDDLSDVVIMLDDMRREGKVREAQMLENAGRAIARANAVTRVAVRRSVLASKPKRLSRMEGGK